MEQAFILLNHFLQFFLMPWVWAALFCLGTQCLLRRRARLAASWARRSLLAGSSASVLTLLYLPLNGGQSSMGYYAALGLVLVLCEAWQLKIWRD